MNTPNYFFYITFGFAVVYIVYRFAFVKKSPLLADIIQIFLAVMAGCSSINLIFLVLDDTKSLGDFQGYKESIILGGVAATWVSIQTLAGLVKNSEEHRRSNSEQPQPETT